MFELALINMLAGAFNAQAETAKAIAALAADQSPEGRTAVANLNEFFALPVAALKWGNARLGIGAATVKAG